MRWMAAQFNELC